MVATRKVGQVCCPIAVGAVLKYPPHNDLPPRAAIGFLMKRPMIGGYNETHWIFWILSDAIRLQVSALSDDAPMGAEV